MSTYTGRDRKGKVVIKVSPDKVAFTTSGWFRMPETFYIQRSAIQTVSVKSGFVKILTNVDEHEFMIRPSKSDGDANQLAAELSSIEEK